MKTYIAILLLPIVLPLFFLPTKIKEMHPELEQYLSGLEAEFDRIPEDRKQKLLELSAFLREKSGKEEPIKLTVICTHNSRRSHMGEAWLHAAAEWYGLENVKTYSGGTEATAFNPRAVAALERAGYSVETVDANSDNPVYRLSLGRGYEPERHFSKKYDHSTNPKEGFAAIMVCAEADAACPFVPGAAARFALPYNDPKAFDGTEQEAEQYDARCRQIAREMFFVMKNAVEK